MRAVLFDLDGVIVNSEWVNVASGVKAFEDLGVRLSEKEKKFIIGRHPVDYCRVFSKKYEFSFEKFRKLQRSYYHKMYKKAKPYPFAKQLIIKLKKNGFLLALVTSSPRKQVKLALKKFKLNDLFDTFVTFEDSSRRKPSPDVYLLAARKIGIKRQYCLVVEDSIPGVNSAKNAGMKCVAVSNNVRPSRLKKANLVVKRLNDRRIWGLLC